MRTHSSFPPLAALFMGGMVVPLVVALFAHDVLELYLTGTQFSLLAGLAFAVAAWVVLEVRSLDSVDFVVAAVVLPWVGAIVLLLAGFAAAGSIDGFGYLFHRVEDLFLYAVFFLVAGVLAVAARRAVSRLSADYAAVPGPRRFALGVAALAVLVVLGGGAVAQATAGGASITAVEPGVVSYSTPSVNVTVAGQPTELRLTLAGPDGSSRTERISLADWRDGTATTAIPFHRFEPLTPRQGTYDVTISGLPGLAVDRTTYTLDHPPDPVLLAVEKARPGEPLEMNLPPDAWTRRPADDDQTRVGLVVENRGDVAARFDTTIRLDTDLVDAHEVFVRPGERSGDVFAIPDETVRRIHAERDGKLPVSLSYGNDTISTTIRLPDPR